MDKHAETCLGEPLGICFFRAHGRFRQSRCNHCCHYDFIPGLYLLSQCLSGTRFTASGSMVIRLEKTIALIFEAHFAEQTGQMPDSVIADNYT